MIKSMGEKCKISIRNIRREANDELKNLLKKKEIDEDEEKKFEKNIQAFTDEHIKNIDVKVSSKEKEPLRAKFKPVGFVVGKNNIYLTTDHGRLFVVDILTGRTKDVIKMDKEKISRPFVLNENLFIIRDNAIIKLN